VQFWKFHPGASAAVAMTMTLSACNVHGSGDSHLALAGKDYCTPFKAASTSSTASTGLAAPTVADPGAAFDDCVHRWSYTLAPARDPADVVAQASVDACGPALTAMSQQTPSQPSDAAPDDQGQPSGASGAVAQQMRMAEAKALFYVVQARAAGCAPPPANSLTTPPVG